MAQARQTMPSTSDLLRRFNRARLASCEFQHGIGLRLALQLRSVWAALASKLIGSLGPQFSTLDVRRDLALKLSTRHL